MTRRPLTWSAHCVATQHGFHVWMCYSHNKGWQQLGVLCLRCGAKTHMSDRQWKLYLEACRSIEPQTSNS